MPDGKRTGAVPPAIPARIALVGFRPYISREAREGDRRQRSALFEVELANDRSLQELVPFARAISAFPAGGTETDVPPESLNLLISTYLKVTGHSGIPELAQMIEYKDGRPYLRKREVDYYAVGILLPPFAESSAVWLGRISCLLSGLTLGLVPAYDRHPRALTVLLLDRKLRLLRKFQYAGHYHSLSTWWMPPGTAPGPKGENNTRDVTPPLEAWAPFVREFSSDLHRFVRHRPLP